MKIIKLLDKKELLNIKTFKDFQNFVEENKEGLEEILSSSLGFSKNKLKLIPEDQKGIFAYIIAKDLLIQSMIKIEREEGDISLEDFWGISFITIGFDFAKVLSQTKDTLTLEKIQSSKIFTYKKNPSIDFPQGEVIFAVTYLENDNFYIDDSYIILEEREADRIYDIILDGPGFLEKDLFVELIIMGRILSQYLRSIDELLENFDQDLVMNFSQPELLRFYNHINGLAKYLFYSDDTNDLFELNYYNFIKDQCQAGNFVIDGDLESFIEIVGFIMDLAGEDLGREVGARKHLRRAEEEIFFLKQELIKTHPLTDRDTMAFVETMVKKGSEDLNEFIKLSFFMDTLYQEEDLDLTLNKHIKLKSIRNFLDIYFPSFGDDDYDFDRQRILVDLAFSVLVANDLIYIDERDQIYPKDRINFFLDEDPVVGLSNIIRGIFRKETFIHYLAKAEKTGEETFYKTMEAIKTNNFYNFGIDKKERDILEMLKALDLLREKNHQGEIFYDFSEIGKFLQDQMEKRDKKAKVINLSDYR